MGFLILCSIFGLIFILSISDEDTIGSGLAIWLVSNLAAYTVYLNWDIIFA